MVGFTPLCLIAMAAVASADEQAAAVADAADNNNVAANAENGDNADDNNADDNNAGAAEDNNAEAETSGAKLTVPSGPRNLFQACRTTLAKLCSKKEMATFSLKCLQTNKEKIADENCKTWLSEYNTCGADKEVKTCQAKSKKLLSLKKAKTQNKCLTEIAEKDKGESLSAECRSTKYFNSLLQFKNRKKELIDRKKEKTEQMKLRLKQKKEELKELKKQAKLGKVAAKKTE